jgi:lysophospholipase L1-like esterase
MRSGPLLVAACLQALAGSVPTTDFGKLALVGDSITQGGHTPSYRHPFWKHLVDHDVTAGTDYTFVGSQTGFHQSLSGGIPATYRGETFANVHEGHWGWRSKWLNADEPLPAGRYNANNLGQGTIANWTGQSATFATGNAGVLAFTASTSVPDTVVMMIGINDFGDGTSAADVESRIGRMVRQYQAANGDVRIHVAAPLPVGAGHASAATINPKVASLNTSLAASAAGWSTATSTVDYMDLRGGFDATTMTYDNVHPNHAGERVIAANLATALGVGPRDTSLGLERVAAADLTGQFNDCDALPGTTAGATFFRAGITANVTDPTAGDSLISLASPTGQASYLQANWALATGAAVTVDVRLKMLDNGQADNTFVVWSDDGTGGAAPGFLRIFPKRTEWGFAGGATRLSLDFSDNTDAFHDFRVAFDGSGYAVWRDGALLADGLFGDASAVAGNRLILGDFSSSGISTSALLDHAAFATTVAVAPVPSRPPVP